MKFLPDRALCREVAVEVQFGVNPLNIEVLGSLGPPPTPTSIGHLVEIFRGGMLRALMWCGSAGDHSCALFRWSIGHLVDLLILRRHSLGGRSGLKYLAGLWLCTGRVSRCGSLTANIPGLGRSGLLIRAGACLASIVSGDLHWWALYW